VECKNIGHRRKKVAEGSRKLHSGHINNVLRIGKVRNTYNILLENQKGKCYLEDIGIVGRTALKWILKDERLRRWIGLMWIEILTSSFCEYGEELSCSIKT
jgi:hypothetical protein